MLKINILFLAIILFLLARGLSSMFGGEAIDYEDRFIALAESFGIMMMLANGSFFATKLFRVALFFVLASVLGAIFKILHLNGADEILLVADLALFITYFVHFTQKKPRIRLDYLKVITLASMLVVAPVVLLHLVSIEQRQIFLISSHILFWITFTDFIYTYGRLLLRD
jgi:hypothetical protein